MEALIRYHQRGTFVKYWYDKKGTRKNRSSWAPLEPVRDSRLSDAYSF